MDRIVCRRAEAIILEIPVAVLVLKPAPLTPGGLSDEDAGPRQPCGVILDKLHIFEGSTGPIRQRHPVTGLDSGVGGEGENASAAAGAEDDGFSCNDLQLTVVNIDGCHTTDLAIIYQKGGCEGLVVAHNAVVFERCLKQGMKHVKAGLVGGEEGAIGRHASEGPCAHTTVRLSAPRTSPVLKLNEFPGGFVDKQLYRVLIGQKVSPKNGILGMEIEAIVVAQNRSGASLGRHRMASHGINFRDHCD